MNMVKRFESFDAYVRQIKLPGHPGNPQDSVMGQGNHGWYGTETYDDAVRLAENGWPHGLGRMQAFKAGIKVFTGELAEALAHRYTEAGDEVDVGRHLSGEPESMLEFVPQFIPAPGRVIKMVVNYAASAGITAEQRFRMGGAATMLCDLLEQSGLRVEIQAVCKWRCTRRHHYGTTYETWINVKKPDQPIELDRLAFVLAHVAMCRRFDFRLDEQNPPDEWRDTGHPIDPTPEELGKGTICFGAAQFGFGRNLNSDEDVARFVKETLAHYTEPQLAAA